MFLQQTQITSINPIFLFHSNNQLQYFSSNQIYLSKISKSEKFHSLIKCILLITNQIQINHETLSKYMNDIIRDADQFGMYIEHEISYLFLAYCDMRIYPKKTVQLKLGWLNKIYLLLWKQQKCDQVLLHYLMNEQMESFIQELHKFYQLCNIKQKQLIFWILELSAQIMMGYTLNQRKNLQKSIKLQYYQSEFSLQKNKNRNKSTLQNILKLLIGEITVITTIASGRWPIYGRLYLLFIDDSISDTKLADGMKKNYLNHKKSSTNNKTQKIILNLKHHQISMFLLNLFQNQNYHQNLQQSLNFIHPSILYSCTHLYMCLNLQGMNLLYNEPTYHEIILEQLLDTLTHTSWELIIIGIQLYCRLYRIPSYSFQNLLYPYLEYGVIQSKSRIQEVNQQIDDLVMYQLEDIAILYLNDLLEIHFKKLSNLTSQMIIVVLLKEKITFDGYTLERVQSYLKFQNSSFNYDILDQLNSFLHQKQYQFHPDILNHLKSIFEPYEKFKQILKIKSLKKQIQSFVNLLNYDQQILFLTETLNIIKIISQRIYSNQNSKQFQINTCQVQYLKLTVNNFLQEWKSKEQLCSEKINLIKKSLFR